MIGASNRFKESNVKTVTAIKTMNMNNWKCVCGFLIARASMLRLAIRLVVSIVIAI